VKTECIAYHHSRAKEYARAQKTYEAIVKAEILFSDAERKRSWEARKRTRAPATAPVPYDASIAPEKVASMSGTQKEVLVSSSSAVRVSTQERVARQMKKNYKIMDQQVQNTDWFFGDSDLTELDESDSDY
jgi:hypothetical protein